MILKAYDNEIKGSLLFETKLPTIHPIAIFLIENNLKKTPEKYYDSSIEGLKVRRNIKTTTEDIEIFRKYLKEHILFDDKEELNRKVEMIYISLESLNNYIGFSKKDFDIFRNYNISFFNSIYEDISDEFEDKIEKIKFFELKLEN